MSPGRPKKELHWRNCAANNISAHQIFIPVLQLCRGMDSTRENALSKTRRETFDLRFYLAQSRNS